MLIRLNRANVLTVREGNGQLKAIVELMNDYGQPIARAEIVPEKGGYQSSKPIADEVARRINGKSGK